MVENHYAQRGHCRHKAGGDVSVEVARPDHSVYRGMVMDYSSAGLVVEISGGKVKGGDPVDITVHKDDKTWNGHGQVRHCMDGRVGIEFDVPSTSILEMMGKGGCTDSAYLMEIAMRNARRKGRDVDALADDIGVSQATLHAIISGLLPVSRLSAENLRQLAKVAGVTVIEAYLAGELLEPEDIEEAKDIVALLA